MGGARFRVIDASGILRWSVVATNSRILSNPRLNASDLQSTRRLPTASKLDNTAGQPVRPSSSLQCSSSAVYLCQLAEAPRITRRQSASAGATSFLPSPTSSSYVSSHTSPHTSFSSPYLSYRAACTVLPPTRSFGVRTTTRGSCFHARYVFLASGLATAALDKQEEPEHRVTDYITRRAKLFGQMEVGDGGAGW